MLVKELIEKLEQFDSEAKVEIYINNNDQTVYQIGDVWRDREGIVTIDGE